MIFFLKETAWLGNELTEYGIKPRNGKIKATLQVKLPTSSKNLKSFLGTLHYFAKFKPKFSEKIDRIRQLVLEKLERKWTQKDKEDLNEIKKTITEKPC